MLAPAASQTWAPLPREDNAAKRDRRPASHPASRDSHEREIFSVAFRFAWVEHGQFELAALLDPGPPVAR
jgi:hypothetical protein